MQTLHMTLLLGRVVVVAGSDPHLADAADLALAGGALVAVISRSLRDETSATVRFNADPCDPDAWERIAMHVEQHLGPVDGVITDDPSRSVVEAVFGPDLARRRHGAVMVARPDDDIEALLTALADTPPAGPSRPRPAAPGR
jgi:hypothetical protein